MNLAEITTGARAIEFHEKNIPMITLETNLTAQEVQEQYVAHKSAVYYFVLDYPRDDDTRFWAIVPDFTFDERFRFVGSGEGSSVRFVEIEKKR